jgi:hypothetical protein
VPPDVASQHRHRVHELREELTPCTPPLFGTDSAREQLAANGQQPVVEDQMAANDEYPANTNDKKPVETNGEQPDQPNDPDHANGHQEPVTMPRVASSFEAHQYRR